MNDNGSVACNANNFVAAITFYFNLCETRNTGRLYVHRDKLWIVSLPLHRGGLKINLDIPLLQYLSAALHHVRTYGTLYLHTVEQRRTKYWANDFVEIRIKSGVLKISSICISMVNAAVNFGNLCVGICRNWFPQDFRVQYITFQYLVSRLSGSNVTSPDPDKRVLVTWSFIKFLGNQKRAELLLKDTLAVLYE